MILCSQINALDSFVSLTRTPLYGYALVKSIDYVARYEQGKYMDICLVIVNRTRFGTSGGVSNKKAPPHQGRNCNSAFKTMPLSSSNHGYLGDHLTS